MDDIIISISNITKDYKNLRAVDDFSLDIRKGEILGLLGPNGSGKTTLVNLICGLIEPSSGNISINGLSPKKDKIAIRKLMGVVPQETALYDDLNAIDNLKFHFALYRDDFKNEKNQIKEILELILLNDRAKDKVATYSGGMKRRLALGRALLHNPQIIILDEPTLGVDVQASHVIWDRIKLLRELGKTIIVTTNVMSEADYLCNKLAIIDKGRLIAFDTPDNLKKSMENDFLECYVADTDLELKGLTDIYKNMILKVEGNRVNIQVPDAEKKIGDIVSYINRFSRIDKLEIRRPTLDDVFLKYTGKSLRE